MPEDSALELRVDYATTCSTGNTGPGEQRQLIAMQVRNKGLVPEIYTPPGRQSYCICFSAEIAIHPDAGTVRSGTVPLRYPCCRRWSFRTRPWTFCKPLLSDPFPVTWMLRVLLPATSPLKNVPVILRNVIKRLHTLIRI